MELTDLVDLVELTDLADLTDLVDLVPVEYVNQNKENCDQYCHPTVKKTFSETLLDNHMHGVRRILTDSKVKSIFLTLSANIINDQQLGKCVRIESNAILIN